MDARSPERGVGTHQSPVESGAVLQDGVAYPMWLELIYRILASCAAEGHYCHGNGVTFVVVSPYDGRVWSFDVMSATATRWSVDASEAYLAGVTPHVSVTTATTMTERYTELHKERTVQQ